MPRPPCLCTGRADVVCTDDHCDLAAPEGAPGDVNRCVPCWLWHHSPDHNRVWGGDGRTKAPRRRHLPCVHLGGETGERIECGTCTNKTRIKLFACSIHGSCTTHKRLDGAACCRGCSTYEPRGRVADPGRVRHLLYHVYPHARDGGAVWRWNVEQLRQRIDLFNGRRIIGVAIGQETETAEAVQAAFAGLGCEFIVRPNVPGLGEMVTFPELLASLANLNGPEHVTFYGHAKGVTSTLWSPTVLRWAEAMYETCLDYWPAVWRLLRDYPLVGSFKRNNWAWQESRSRWHFSGTFRWSRNADLYARNWREIDRFWSGSESHPSLHFQTTEAAALIAEFGEQAGNMLYEENSWKQVGEAPLARFRADHVADRREALPALSFAVVSIVHNEELIVDAFVRHYLRQGAAKIVLIDNESTDATVERARRHPEVEVRTLASGGLNDALRMRAFQQARESLAGHYDWVVLVDTDEFIIPKGGSTIRDVLALHPLASALGCEGWDVAQRPEDKPLDWTHSPLLQRTHGEANAGYGKPVVVRPGGSERLVPGQHFFSTSPPYPAVAPFLLLHLANADETLYLRRRLQMTARQSPANAGYSVQHTGQTEESLRQRWQAIQHNPALTALPLPAPLPSIVRPDDVRGWLSRPEAEALARLAAGRRALEIGTYCGLSAIVLARVAEHLVCVDPFTMVGLPDEGEDSYAECVANLDRYGVRERVSIYRGLSADVLPTLHGSFDAVFIDGKHDTENIRRDIELALPLTRTGSWLAFHDYGCDLWPDVKTVVDAWRGERHFERVDSLALIRL